MRELITIIGTLGILCYGCSSSKIPEKTLVHNANSTIQNKNNDSIVVARHKLTESDAQ